MNASSSRSFPHNNDEHWMRLALDEARQSLQFSPPDVPIGALCVHQNRIVAAACNRREREENPVAHAEVLALQEAARVLRTRHLDDVTLYVTLEPCPMCAGAIWLARVGRVVFGARDEKAGACGSVFDIARDPRLNYRPQVRAGVLSEECAALLAEFFAARRNTLPKP